MIWVSVGGRDDTATISGNDDNVEWEEDEDKKEENLTYNDYYLLHTVER